MTTVTDEQKEELVDAIKGPRYYRIVVNGYGGESSYMKISQAAHDFWRDHKEQYGDHDLVQYMVNAEAEDYELEDLEGVPAEAEFMKDEDGDGRPWYEPPNELEHTYGATYDSSWISVDEVADSEYNSDHVCEVIDREEVTELVDRVYEDSGDDYIEINEYSCCDEHPDAEYIAQMYSSEKGTFFDGILETTGDFDPRKLKIHVVEYLNGEDTITSIEYDGEEVDNMGGDTNGKGYFADVWRAN